MSMLPTKQPTYKDGRTKQSFKDETDINKILKRAQKTGTISHLNKHEARYADFGDFDFFEAQIKISAGRTMFDELPSEIRNEFNQSPAAFFKYVNDPENKDRLAELLPGLAEPGRQNLTVNAPTVDENKAGADSEADKTPAKTDESAAVVEKTPEPMATQPTAKQPIPPSGVEL